MKISFSPRSSQREILHYKRGRLGISAVPGSGKTHTLSALAAQIISEGQLGADQEVLIVTLVNSAVDNFSSRIADFVQTKGLIPHLGYRVRTLHGLAHEIVRENPPLVGLDSQFSIVDESVSSAMIHDAARAWVHQNPDFLLSYLSGNLDHQKLRRVRSKEWPELVETLAISFIRSAKDHRMTPERLRLVVEQQPSHLPLVEMGLAIYSDYQRALTYRGAVDFDDLIRLAVQLLESSSELLDRLAYRWPFILEDEAQDSSKMQQAIISHLVGEHGNWVRVGDPNQAIFETFTTANPELLRQFIENFPSVEMPESGRCQPAIMDIANYLIEWSMGQHPVPEVRNALSRPLIVPVPVGDPQPNPPNDPSGVVFHTSKLTADAEIQQIVKSIADWLPENPEKTVAVLSSTNNHAARVADSLKRAHLPYRELLRSTSPTRAAAGALSHILTYLATPDSASKLAQAYKVWRRDWREESQLHHLTDRVAGILAKVREVEAYLAPSVPYGAIHPGQGFTWLDQALISVDESLRQEVITEMEDFRGLVIRWNGATILPIDQLLLTIGQDIFTSAADLAVAHKLALVMRQVADENPHWRLPELTPHLHEIARNERRFIGFSSDDAGFDPNLHRGIVVVSTMHKAKGLEWDRVYLLSVNDYDYPSAQPTDRYISERWFLRDGLNLEAEALDQLEACLNISEYKYYEEGRATRRARLNYVRERLRLLYVGITRARRELIVTWNSGRQGDARPALSLVALHDWWQSR